MELIEPSGEVVAFEQEHIENAPKVQKGQGKKINGKRKEKLSVDKFRFNWRRSARLVNLEDLITEDQPGRD